MTAPETDKNELRFSLYCFQMILYTTDTNIWNMPANKIVAVYVIVDINCYNLNGNIYQMQKYL